MLYILHSFYVNEDWMARPVVNFSTIYGNLLADGEAEEMIIVLPYIFCDKKMPYCTGMDLKNCLAYDNFINDLIADLMPFIEGSYSVVKGRDNTTITGFFYGRQVVAFYRLHVPRTIRLYRSCLLCPRYCGDTELTYAPRSDNR